MFGSFVILMYLTVRGNSQRIVSVLLTDDNPLSITGTRMLSTIAKYLQLGEELVVNRFEQDVDSGTVEKSLKEEKHTLQTVISLLTDDMVVSKLKHYAEKHGIPFVQVDQNFRSGDDSVEIHEAASLNSRKGKHTYISVIPPWLTMLGVLMPLTSSQQLDSVIVLHDDNFENLLTGVLEMIGEKITVSLMKIESDEAHCWMQQSCINMNKTTLLFLMAETMALQTCLKQLENCSKVDITPFDMYLTYARALWIRPHYVNSMKEIDSIITWCKQENLDTELFRMGRELEISFYYRVFSVVAAKYAVPNTNVRLSALVTHCLSDVQENSTQFAVTDLCESKPEFGPYLKLNNDDFFEDIHLNIYHIFATPAGKEIYLVAKWNQANGIDVFNKRELFPFEESSSHYRVAVIQGAPFIQINRDKSGSRRYTGYCIDLIKTISEQLNFTYEVYDVPLVQYKRLYFSKALKGSKIYGIIPELHEGNANIALANIHPTSAGELLVDFTIPFYENVGLAALIKASKDPNALWQFLLIIEWPVALCTVLSVLISSALLTLFDIFSPFSWHNRKNCEIKETGRKHLLMKENLWFCMMSFTLQGAGENPRNLSGRIVAAAYWICLFLLTGTYSAVLANRLTARSFLQELDDVEQLFDQNRIQYSVVEGSSTMKYFQRLAEVEKALVENWRKRVKDPSLEPVDRAYIATWDYPFPRLYHRIFEFIKHVGMPRTNLEGIDRVLASKPPAHFVLLDPVLFTVENGTWGSSEEIPAIAYTTKLTGDASLLEYASQQHCNLRVVTSKLNERPYAMAVQQGSRLLRDLSNELNRLRNQGILNALKKKWFKKNYTCQRNDEPNEISMKKVSGMFILMCLGLAISTATLVSQFTMKKRTAKVTSSQKEKEANDYSFFHIQRNRTRPHESTGLPVVQ